MDKYMIPPRFKFSPKVWRDFSFKSMGYLMVFSYPAVLILKSHLALSAKIFLAMPFLVIAWFLSTYEKYGRSLDLIAFIWLVYILSPKGYRQFKQEKSKAHSTNELVPIKAFHDDMVEFTNGNFAKILKVSSLNYELMSDQEKRSAEASFRELCHSLTMGFPVQTFMRSRRLGFDDLIKNMEDGPDDNIYKRTRENYREFLEELAQEGRIHQKEFYIVIPYNPHSAPRGASSPAALLSLAKEIYLPKRASKIKLADVKEQIKLREEIVRDGIQRCRLEAETLKRKDIAQLFYDELNPDLEGCPSRHVNIGSFIEGMDEKKLRSMIAPTAVDMGKDYMKIGNLYVRVLTVYEWPTVLFPGWVQAVNDLADDLDVSIHISPRNMQQDIKVLSNQIKKMHSSTMADRLSGFADDHLALVQKEQSEGLMRRFAAGEEKTFDFIILVTLKAQSLEELDDKTASVKSKLGAREITVDVPCYQMKDYFLTYVPFGMPRVPLDRPFTSSLIGASFPMGSKDFSSGGGVLYGVSEDGSSIITLDRFKATSNFSMCVTGASGSGKSFMVKALLSREISRGVQAVVIDVESEFVAMCKQMGGQHVVIAANSPSSINPLDRKFRLADQSIASIDSLVRDNMLFLQLVMEDAKIDYDPLSAEELLYELYRIHEQPLLRDLQNLARKMKMENVARSLNPWVEGTLRGLFDRETNIDLESPFVVFDLSRMRKEHRALAITVISEWFWKVIKQDRVRRLFVLDEASYLLRQEECAFAFENIARRGRKYGVGITLIDQQIDQLFSSERSRAIISNCAIKCMFYTDRGLVDNHVSKAINLTEKEKELIMTLGVGECLLHAGPHRARIKVKASKREMELFSTTIADLKDVAV